MNIAKKCGASKVGVLSTKHFIFDPYLRELCKNNSCGRYNTSWTCPPGVGEIEELKKEIQEYDNCLIVQCISNLEDSFDVEGMDKGRIKADRIMRNIKKEIANKYNLDQFKFFSVGSCTLCEKCTYPDSECRYPNEIMPSLEAFGISIKDAVEECNLSYINGKNTVSYVGGVLF